MSSTAGDFDGLVSPKRKVERLTATTHVWRLGIVISATLLAGCSVLPAVTLTTPTQSFTQTFTHGYSSITAGGDDVVVLVDDPADSSLRHVLRIRMLWHPVNGAKPNSPAATNAALHFFVLTGANAKNSGYIHYAGTGFVTVEHDGQDAKVVVRNANLAELESHGTLVDPLHAFKLSGDFDATLDGHKVDAVLAELAKTVPKNIAAPATSPAPKTLLP